MIKKGLIGHTGFIGNFLKKKLSIKYNFSSKNISEITKYKFDKIYCAAPSSLMWKANKNLLNDFKNIINLCSTLNKAKINKFILISSIEVYNKKTNCNEKSPTSTQSLTYGSNRAFFENFIKTRFVDHHIIRLPIVYGYGQKKNIIFDLVNNNCVENINKNNILQFYPIKMLINDINKVINHKLKFCNITSEQIKVTEILEKIKKKDFVTLKNLPLRRYNMKSIFANHWNNKNYNYSKKFILNDIKKFYYNEIFNK
ncbi:hypothetical protein N9382_00020 [bacterium]|nr:hypothetical protein [bacterium]